ncbi:MAG: RHS repeat protein, partial [Bacteroidales bacterium]|nr:RHS repeat protein [Bacteroidales bacterium]
MIKMKYIPSMLVVFFTCFQIQAQIDFNNSAIKANNYVYAKTNNLLTAGGTHTIETMQYFDGLGRPLQTVYYKNSPATKDIIQPFEYDAYGREVVKYLPYSSTASGVYRSDWKTAQSTFHTNLFGSTDGTKAYAQTKYEDSPLNRVMKQGAPGNSWQPVMTTTARISNELVTSYQYASNSSETVYYWTISGTSTITFTKKTFALNALFKNIITDENSHPVTEYKDKQGKVVLKVDANGGKTYYIYDNFELLRCVIPPLASPTLAASSKISFTSNDADFKELCYYYEYDHRNRMIKKKLAGTNGIYTMTYDDLDRLTETTDPNGNKTYIDYDDFSRPVETGIYIGSTKSWLTKTYYDKYDHDIDYAAPGSSFKFVLAYTGIVADLNVKGKATVVKTKVIDPAAGMKTELISVTYYDKYGKIIQTVSDNHKNGIDRISFKHKYKNSDLVEEKKHQHNINGGTTFTVVEKYTYDHAGRLLTASHGINGATPTEMSSITYNEAGQVSLKKMGKVSTSYLQENDYKYNIRGWLTQMNDPDASNSKKMFSLKLGYVYYGNSTNISDMVWKNADGVKRKYSFSYDLLDRLTTAYYYYPTAETNKYSESYTYDVNGNIQTVTRKGVVNDGTGLVGYIDQLTYKYFNSQRSNRLWAVGDNAADVSGRGDFEESWSNGFASQEYYYDNNGNATDDNNKGICIYYNLLNLPKWTLSNYDDMYFTYSALGEKISQMDSYDDIRTDYIGPFVYKNNTLAYILTSEGRAVYSGTSFSYYEYHVKDHLGNVRIAFKPWGTSVTVLQSSDYYPFGLRMASSTGKSYSNKYLYNGKEIIAELEMPLNWYDYGA